MSATSRQSVHRLRLRNAQALACERDRWLSLEARINQLRTRELKKVVANGGIQTQRDLLLSAAMNRMYEVREVRPLFFACGKEELSVIMCLSLDDELVIDCSGQPLPDPQFSPAAISPPIFPPGKTNLRQSPRRPGAPSADPALINPFLINAGRDTAPADRSTAKTPRAA